MPYVHETESSLQLDFLHFEVQEVATSIGSELDFSVMLKFPSVSSYEEVRTDMLITRSESDIAKLLMDYVDSEKAQTEVRVVYAQSCFRTSVTPVSITFSWLNEDQWRENPFSGTRCFSVLSVVSLTIGSILSRPPDIC